MRPATRQRLGLLLPLLAIAATGCSDDPATNLVAAILGTVVGLLVGVSCGCSLFMGVIAGGAINVRHNLQAPTKRSKRWGFVFGALNVVDGVIALAVLVTLIRAPATEDPPEPASYLVIAGLGLAALAMGGVGLWAAATAVPQPPRIPLDVGDDDEDLDDPE